MIKLGNTVKDNVTGFEGIATGRTVFLFGCIRILIEPEKLGSDGKPIDGQWFDEQRVEEVIRKENSEDIPASGGPQNDCIIPQIPKW